MQVSWLQTEIVKFVLENKHNSLSTINPIVEVWICRLNQDDVQEKKEQIKAVANWIRLEKHFSVNQLNLGLYLLERVCLSRRVCNLARAELYSRKFVEHSSHELHLRGLVRYLKIRFPDVTIFTYDIPEEKNIHRIQKYLNEKDNVWILFRPAWIEFKSLFYIRKRVERVERYEVYFFNSLGLDFKEKINESDRYKKDYLQFVKTLMHKKNAIYYCLPNKRSEGSNNASFIVSDLEVALKLLKDSSKPLFDYGEPHPLFYRVSQLGSAFVLQEHLVSEQREKPANVLPTLINLDIFEALLMDYTFAAKDYSEPGSSEGEVQDCVIS
jgi:hypothetical protein